MLQAAGGLPGTICMRLAAKRAGTRCTADTQQKQKVKTTLKTDHILNSFKLTSWIGELDEDEWTEVAVLVLVGKVVCRDSLQIYTS